MTIFINDWHTIINFGIHKNKRLLDVPEDYLDWILNNIKYGPIYEAVFRIKNRKGVTTIIKNQNIQNYIPDLKEDTDNALPIIIRPNDINFSLFGIFTEYYVKYNLGILKFDKVVEYLALFGLAKLPDHLKFHGEFEKPNTRTKYIAKSFNNKIYDVLDICNMSFSHPLLLNTYNENEGTKLFHYIKQNKQYFDDLSHVIKNFSNIPKFLDKEQEKCDKISVGCVIGEIDAISESNIIDIKCCENDNINYYRKQLFAYACLYYLRYGKHITHCKIFNFITGKIFIMDVQNITDEIAQEHIKNMGSYCKFHINLFGK